MLVKINAQQNSYKNISVDNGLPSNIIFDIKQDNFGYLWIATNKGLVKFDGDDFTQINKLKTNNLFVKENTVFAGLENGLFIKKKSKELFIKNKKVTKVFSYRNTIFVGSYEGIFYLKNDELFPIKINTTIDFSIINDIIFCNNSFYIATNNGLFIISNLLKPQKINKINNDNIVSLISFNDKIIAATSFNKILVINGKTIINTIETLDNISTVKKLKNEIWVTSKTNGIEVFVLPSFSFKQKINKYNSLNTNTIHNVFKDNYNTTYMASDKGIYVMNADNFDNKNNTKPKIFFENLLINHQNVDSLLTVKKVRLSHLENNISISYKTVDLINPNKIEYRYKLKNNFSPWSSNNTIQFPNLSTGKYVFQVQSRIKNHESKLKSFSFIIDVPFYLKAWFIFSIVILLLIFSYIFLGNRINTIKRKNKEKVDKLKLKNRLLILEQKALQLQMNPHFIFNVLNGIKALGNSGKTNELNNTISNFSVLLRGILNNSRKDEITLKEEIELLNNYIVLEQKMSSKSFTYTINTKLNNIDADEILLPTMLIQPFVENSIQHAFQKNKVGNIYIDFEVKHHFLYCTVKDNGIGINQSKKKKVNNHHKSVALNVSKERLNIITSKNYYKVSEIINDDIIKGTKISFRIPLKTDY